MKKVNVGLDIGVASVGWSIYDIENKKIIDAGVRLFSEANAGGQKSNSAADRRAQRGRRRSLRRRNLRKKDTINLFVKYNFLQDFDSFYKLNFTINYLEIRKKALNEKISIEELIIILYAYVKKRGSFNFKDDLMELKNDDVENIKLEDLNEKTKSPVEIQSQNFITHNKYRGLNSSESLIAHEWYKDEVNKILDKQIEHKVVSEQFKEDFLAIYTRKRHYSEGPGWVDRLKTKKSVYGWKNTDEWYQKLSGFDTYDRKEYRAPKNSMTAYLFNILNDINNLKIYSRPEGLTSDEKLNLIESVINHTGKTSKNITLKYIAKFLNVEEKEISGYRIDKKEKPVFTEFKSINLMRKILKENNLDCSFISLKNIDLLDKVCEILTIQQTVETRENKLKELKEPLLTQNHCELLALINTINGTHSLSFKTMKEIIEHMWVENKNQMEIFADNKIKPDYKFQSDLKELKNIPILRKQINEMYIPPSVKRALLETLKVIKEIEAREEIQIKDIVIELARETNSEEAKKNEKQFQARNEENKKKINDTYNTSSYKMSPKLRDKLIFLKEQDGVCMYSGKKIDVERIKMDDNYCEIDHMLPFSQSFDNSKANKVLVLREENQNKGQNTPYQYFRRIGRNWEEYRNRCINIYLKQDLGKYGKTKYYNATFEFDLNDDEVKKEFISRNLNDTRYVTVEVKNYLNYFKYELNRKWNIKTINGKFTSFVRGAFLHLSKKNRDIYNHHAIDATVCALAPIIDIGGKMTMNRLNKSNQELSEEQIIYQNEIDKIKEDINTFEYKFTRKVEKKVNIQLFEETIYTTRYDENNKLHKVSKLDLLSMDKDTEQNLKRFFVDEPQYLLIYESDKKTFDFLKKIYDEYVEMKDDKNKSIKNPFVYFKNVEGGVITKQSNEEKPPIIRYLRYIDKKDVNTYTDISKKFRGIKKDKKIITTGANSVAYDLWFSKTLNKYKILPINKDVAKFSTGTDDITLIELEYNKQKNNLEIDDTYEMMVRMFKFNELEYEYDGKIEQYVIVGYNRAKKCIEFKPIDYLDKGRIYKSVSKMKKIKLITTNSTRNKIKKINCF